MWLLSVEEVKDDLKAKCRGLKKLRKSRAKLGCNSHTNSNMIVDRLIIKFTYEKAQKESHFSKDLLWLITYFLTRQEFYTLKNILFLQKDAKMSEEIRPKRPACIPLRLNTRTPQ